MKLTERERRLVALINELAGHVEVLGCTCNPEDCNSRHAQLNRRRQDSPCTGVRLAVHAEMRKRRALRVRRFATPRISLGRTNPGG